MRIYFDEHISHDYGGLPVYLHTDFRWFVSQSEPNFVISRPLVVTPKQPVDSFKGKYLVEEL